MVEALPLYDWITEGKCVSTITSYCMSCFVDHIPVLLLGQRSCLKRSQRSMCIGKRACMVMRLYIHACYSVSCELPLLLNTHAFTQLQCNTHV